MNKTCSGWGEESEEAPLRSQAGDLLMITRSFLGVRCHYFDVNVAKRSDLHVSLVEGLFGGRSGICD